MLGESTSRAGNCYHADVSSYQLLVGCGSSPLIGSEEEAGITVVPDEDAESQDHSLSKHASGSQSPFSLQLQSCVVSGTSVPSSHPVSKAALVSMPGLGWVNTNLYLLEEWAKIIAPTAKKHSHFGALIL